MRFPRYLSEEIAKVSNKVAVHYNHGNTEVSKDVFAGLDHVFGYSGDSEDRRPRWSCLPSLGENELRGFQCRLGCREKKGTQFLHLRHTSSLVLSIPYQLVRLFDSGVALVQLHPLHSLRTRFDCFSFLPKRAASNLE